MSSTNKIQIGSLVKINDKSYFNRGDYAIVIGNRDNDAISYLVIMRTKEIVDLYNFKLDFIC